jgi:hypothetical protein
MSRGPCQSVVEGHVSAVNSEFHGAVIRGVRQKSPSSITIRMPDAPMQQQDWLIERMEKSLPAHLGRRMGFCDRVSAEKDVCTYHTVLRGGSESGRLTSNGRICTMCVAERLRRIPLRLLQRNGSVLRGLKWELLCSRQPIESRSHNNHSASFR